MRALACLCVCVWVCPGTTAWLTVDEGGAIKPSLGPVFYSNPRSIRVQEPESTATPRKSGPKVTPTRAHATGVLPILAPPGWASIAARKDGSGLQPEADALQCQKRPITVSKETYYTDAG